MKQPGEPRVLVIDDNPDIHEDYRKILEGKTMAERGFLAEKEELFGQEPGGRDAQRFRIDSAYQGEEGLALVESSVRAGDPYSLAFVDIRMPPGWDGIETIGRIWSVDPKLQVVICSAYSDYSWDQILRRLGHSDNFLILRKPFDNVEVIQMAHALARKWALAREAESRLENAESAARLSEERFSAAFHSSPMPMSIQSLRTGQLLEVNEEFVAVSGYSRSELLYTPSPAPDLWVPSPGSPAFWELLNRGEPVRECPGNIRTKAGELRPVRVSAELLQLSAEPLALIVTEDVSEQVRIEAQLRHAQKMEAVGQLAAGIAHDFNNNLTVILGHLSLLLEDCSSESPVEKSIHQALRAGQRAAALTRQLLAFSRKQVMERKAIHVAELFGELQSLVQRALGEHIRVIFSAPASLPPVYADAGNLEQVILNLAVNARDAMPNGGELRIHAEAVCVSHEIAQGIPDATAGTFIHLAVTDTGCGMDDITKARAFEPFFTTKEKGKGTGMGLAMVYGVVRQHQGWIQLASQPGQGTTFNIFLPVAVETAIGNPAASPAPVPEVRGSPGGETILVVEDEDMIARYVQAVLGRHGYRTFLARDGAEAWKLWQNRKGPIDLLLTDIVMPNGMSGKDLAERLSAEIPEVPIVFTSGYSLDVLGLDPNLGASRYLLQKPYQSEVLLDTIRRALDAKGAGPGHIVHLPRDCDKSLPGTESNVQPPKPLPPT